MVTCCQRIKDLTHMFENGYDHVMNEIHIGYDGRVIYHGRLIEELHFRYCPYCGYSFPDYVVVGEGAEL